MEQLNHIAIIMDGNGRWAQQRNKPRAVGHVKGTRVAKKIIKHASDQGIKYLTLYAFSAENWSRPAAEVSFLMGLLERYLKKETENLVKENIRFSIIGTVDKLPDGIKKHIHRAVEQTKDCTGLELCFALSYGSRQEITEAVKKIAQQVSAGKILAADIDENTVNQNLMTASRPDPDFVIRTSGEQRISNFLLWQCAYSEFYFADVLWPDYTIADFDLACSSFYARERRFGKVKDTTHVELNH